MKVIFAGKGWKEYNYIGEVDQRVFKKINKIIESIIRNGHEGIGDAEPLKHEFSGWWAKQVDVKHRLVYRLLPDDVIEILKCIGHYNDK